MSNKRNLYRHGELEAIANHLNTDLILFLDADDLQALLANISERLGASIKWAESEITRLEQQHERLVDRLDGVVP